MLAWDREQQLPTTAPSRSVITEAGKRDWGSGSDRSEARISKQGVGSGI